MFGTNSPAPITQAVTTFAAWDRVTGQPIEVDDRTYDQQRHTMDEAEAAAIRATLAAAVL